MKTGFSLKIMVPALLAVALAAPPRAWAQLPPCTNNAISNSGGGTIILRNGQQYATYPGTSGRTMTWMPGDKVTVCPLGGSSYEMTNTSKTNPSSVKVLRRR